MEILLAHPQQDWYLLRGFPRITSIINIPITQTIVLFVKSTKRATVVASKLP